MRTLAFVCLGAALLSCGPEPAAQPAELEEICGAPGPYRLFALEPAETLAALVGVSRVADRLLFFAGPGVDASAIGLPTPADPTLYSTDLCGEDRVVVADDIGSLYPRLTRWPEALVACSEAYRGDLYLLDPSGAVEPTQLLAGGCDAWPSASDHGLLRVEPTDDALARIVLVPYAAGATPGFEAPVVLLAGVPSRPHNPQILADEVLALDPGGDLVRVSLPDGATTIEVSDVWEFAASSDGRWLLWQDARTLDGEPGHLHGDIFLRDRQTGVDTLVAHTYLRYRWPVFGSDFARISFGSSAGERFVSLPSLAVSDVPPGWRSVRRIADGRWLLAQDFPTAAPFALRDLVTGAQTLLTDMPGAAAMGDDFLDILRDTDSDSQYGTGELWRFRYDGSGPELLARRAGRGFRRTLSDGRLITVIEADATGYGRLIAVDPETLAETVIDERVFALAIGPQLFDDDTIAYQVVDGDRSGVWLARLAPLE